VADDLEAYLGEVLIGGLEPGGIMLAAYDPAWAARYEREAATIRAALGAIALRVEHVGSTAVPGLVAKPIIDILVVVYDSSREGTYLPELERAGYVLRVREPAFHEHRMLRTPGADVHVHVYPADSAEIGRMLGFRDRLRRSARDRDAYAAAKRRLASRPWKSMQHYAEAKSPVIERILAGAGSDENRESFRRLLAPALVGLLVFMYQVPLSVVAPDNIRWLMKGDRSAPLSGWLFERNEPWTLPFGILHTMIAPLVMTVGYSDALPLVAAPAKLLFGWVTTPWQYSGAFLLLCYVLQGVFGYLVLRALRTGRGLSILGAAFFASSPALLHRFEHVSLSAHWELLAAWWLYLRRPTSGPSWRYLWPWLVLLTITIPTYGYLALMVGCICSASYVRAVWIDQTVSWRAAAWHAVVGATTVAGVFWVFGYFVIGSLYESGFGQFSADLLAFFNSAGLSSFVRPFPTIGRDYENFYYLGLGMIALLPFAIAFAIALRRRNAAGRTGPRFPGWPPLWPGVLAACVMFAYALSTPVRFAGHPLFDVPLYAHIVDFTGWFRGSGRFAWPLYYLVIALTVAVIVQYARPALAFALLGAALMLQLADMRVLRGIVQRDYTHPWPRLESPAWQGLGRSFRSVRLAPPIIAHHTACRRYDRPNDYEIRFGVMAAEQGMAFNSAYPARIDWNPGWCQPMLDSLARGELDPTTVYIPSATYREAIEWWAAGRAVCGTIEEANVCVARPEPGAAVAPFTKLLLRQEPVPAPIVLHADLRRGDPAAVVDLVRGFERPDSGGRVIAAPVNAPRRGVVYFNRAMTGAITLVVEASASGASRPVPVTVTFGGESRIIPVGPAVTTDTLRFTEERGPQILSFVPGSAESPAAASSAGMVPIPPRISIRQLAIWLEQPGR